MALEGFFPEGKGAIAEFCQVVAKSIFSGGVSSCEISCYQLETKRKTFSTRKISKFNSYKEAVVPQSDVNIGENTINAERL